MKNSTKRNLYKLGGLVFAPKKDDLPYKVYKGIHGWVAAGRPSPAYIFDCYLHLSRVGIPIVDAVMHQGIMTKVPAGRPRKLLKVRTKNVSPMAFPKLHGDLIDGVQASETKQHHKMSY